MVIPLPIPAVKLVTQVVAGLGVGRIVSSIVRNNVSVISTFDKVVVNTGGFVLGSMIVEQANNHIERSVDDVVKLLKSKGVVKDEV